MLEIVADNQSHDDAIDVLLLLTLLFLPLFVSFLAKKREDVLELGFKALNLEQHTKSSKSVAFYPQNHPIP